MPYLVGFIVIWFFIGCSALHPPPVSKDQQLEPLSTSEIPEGLFLLEENDLGIQISKSQKHLLIHFIHGSEAINKNLLIVDSDTLLPHFTQFCIEPKLITCQFNSTCKPCTFKNYELTSYYGYQSMVFKRNNRLFFGILGTKEPYISFWELPFSAL